ncbi:MAG: hypothetical protein A2Y94_11525 [Caldithrix sp. RBG_13_44_9]|nr:MAG: hypothetical protein A2Y94_11525 [Caldithrix sp. RBG_13_44_9]
MYGVYSRVYNGSSWSGETSPWFNTGVIQDRYSSIAVDPDGNLLAAWCAQRQGDPDYRIMFRRGYPNNTWSDWKVEFPKIPGINSQCPAITYYNKGGINPYGVKIIYYTSDKTIRLKIYDIGTDWDEEVRYDNGLYANLTMENAASGYPSFIWTDRDGPYYKIINDVDEELENLEILASNGILQRRAVVSAPDSITEFSFDLGPIYYTTTAGEEVPIYLTGYDFRVPHSFNSQNLWNYLETDTFSLPVDAKELHFEKSFSFSVRSDSTQKPIIIKFLNYNYQLLLKDVTNNATLAILDNDKNSGIKSINISNYVNKSVIIKPLINISGNLMNKFSYGLVDIIYPTSGGLKNLNKKELTTSSLEIKQFQIYQNYPNPFNSITNIKYAIPEKSFVKIDIYNILGEKVLTLLSKEQEAGENNIIWNATDFLGNTVSSGIYLYKIEAKSIKTRKEYFQIKKLIYLK